MRLHRPLDEKHIVRITQRFTPPTHYGVDYSCVIGTPLYSPAAGRVYHHEQPDGFGRYARIETPDGNHIYLAHMWDWIGESGREVQPGSLVGWSGNSGNSTGPHLHFEVRMGGREQHRAVDPEPLIAWGLDGIAWVLEKQEMARKTGWHIQRVHDWMPALAVEWGRETWQKVVNPGEANPLPGVRHIVVRFWHDDTQESYIRDGEAGGRRWVRDFLPRFRTRPWATCFETANEPDCNSNEGLANLRRYSLGAMKEADLHGIKLCILNLPQGNPGSDPRQTEAEQRHAERWKLEQLAEAVRYAAEHGHYVGLHAYWLPDRGIGPLDRWHSLGRVEWNVQQWISMGVLAENLRVLINEVGVDGLIENRREGWRIRSNLLEYSLHIAEAEAWARTRPWVLGMQLFTVGYEGEWGTYDHTESDLREIMAALQVTAPVDPPVAVPPPVVQPPTEPPQEIPTMLQNKNFDIFRYWKGISEVRVAEGWEPFWHKHDPGNPSYDARPEYKRSGDETDGPRRAPGSYQYAQQWFNWSRHHRAGIYQQVSAIPEQLYSFSVLAMAWYSIGNDPTKSERNDDDPGYAVKVGIDPTGGTDAFADSVVWSEAVYPHDTWHVVEVEAEAEADVITVFVLGEPTWPVENVNCYVSAAKLEQANPWSTDYALPSTDPLTIEAIESGDVYQMYQKRRWWNEHAVRLLEDGDVAQALAVLRDMSDVESGLDYVIERALQN